ncbi:NUDIX domain-containing protein [Olivibacter sp. CPCC 100613]|uniref:NUDIX hydrolase n=1 Tax=Olivibacter sp. CPCC 100613 TaxID=3079931 RepID=UPI002FFB7D4B
MIPVKLYTAGLVVLKESKLLLAFSNNKKAWYLPGGKIDGHETSHEAIIREIGEELGIILDTDLLTFYCHITAPAYGEDSSVIMEQDCFRYEMKETIYPANEIGDVDFFDQADYAKQGAQVPGVLQLFEVLIADGLI